ncbi:hypothetical protein ONZ45_g11582 [Pleurotus djamor]|nr:hypothetical protein ONZ45_g11582 [Pleurotus djamor]
MTNKIQRSISGNLISKHKNFNIRRTRLQPRLNRNFNRFRMKSISSIVRRRRLHRMRQFILKKRLFKTIQPDTRLMQEPFRPAMHRQPV